MPAKLLEEFLNKKLSKFYYEQCLKPKSREKNIKTSLTEFSSCISDENEV